MCHGKLQLETTLFFPLLVKTFSPFLERKVPLAYLHCRYHPSSFYPWCPDLHCQDTLSLWWQVRERKELEFSPWERPKCEGCGGWHSRFCTSIEALYRRNPAWSRTKLLRGRRIESSPCHRSRVQKSENRKAFFSGKALKRFGISHRHIISTIRLTRYLIWPESYDRPLYLYFLLNDSFMSR